jgi:hypothetical protein
LNPTNSLQIVGWGEVARGTTFYGGKEIFPVSKAPKQCPLVLLVKIVEEKFIFLRVKVKLYLGRAVAQAVSRWLPTATAEVFSEYSGFPCQSFHRLLHTHPSSEAGTLCQIVADSVSPRPKNKDYKKAISVTHHGGLY